MAKEKTLAGQFNSQITPATWKKVPGVPFTNLDNNDLSPEEKRLAGVMASLYQMSSERCPWMAGDTFTCDGGALAAYLIAQRLSIPASLHVGLYHHQDVELRAEGMGEYQGDLSDDQWDAELDDIEAHAMDEHHHWVLLHPGEPDEMLVDPNGPARREPYMTRVSRTIDLDFVYRDGAEPLVYDPEDDPEEIARDVYPGLLELVDDVLRESVAQQLTEQRGAWGHASQVP